VRGGDDELSPEAIGHVFTRSVSVVKCRLSEIASSHWYDVSYLRWVANERLRTAGAPQTLSGRYFHRLLGLGAQDKLSVKIATPRI
jgi:hypothetical protein